MNKLIIALSLACASAYVFADSIVGATPSKVTTNDWFSAKVENAGAVTNGCTVTSATEPTIAGGKFVIDSELNAPVTFTATNSTAALDMVTVNFTLDTAIVPIDARDVDLASKSAKVAFAVSEVSDSANGYYAWLGSSWVLLTGTPKADGASYDLGVTFKGDKVQFRVDGTVLTTNNVEWLSYGAGAAVPTTMAIDLVGSGNVTSFVGSQLKIEAEIVAPTDCGPIEIPETDMAAFRNTATGDVDAFIKSYASEAFPGKFAKTSISVGTAYALGLIENRNGTMVAKGDGVLKAMAVAQSTASGIKLQLNARPTQGTGAHISYKIMEGSKEIVTDLSADGIVIPANEIGTGLKIFKVQAVVTPASAK